MHRSLTLFSLAAFTAMTACAPHQSSSSMPSTMPDSAPMMMVHHLGMSVPNLEATSAWYEKNLDFTVKQPRSPAPEVGAQVALLEKNGFILELYEKRGSRKAPKPMPKNIPEDLMIQGPKHIAFMVADVDALAAKLKQNGVRFLAGPIDLKSTRLRVINIFDNNGNVVEIAQQI